MPTAIGRPRPIEPPDISAPGVYDIMPDIGRRLSSQP